MSTHAMPRPRRLVASLAILYALALVVALLMPSPATPVPPHEHRFLETERLRAGRMAVGDALVNVAVFVPAGLLFHAALRSGRPPTAAMGVTATLGGAALSLGAEMLQYLIPGRYSSAADVLANVAGLVLGVLVDRVIAARR